MRTPDASPPVGLTDSAGRLASRVGAVFALGLALGLTSWYGGLRSPDSEVVYEVCAAIVDDGSFSVRNVSQWRGFGVVPGRGGRPYSVFGPGQSVACAPALLVVRQVRHALDLHVEPAPSHFLTNGLESFATGAPLVDPSAHADRAGVSLLGPLFGALACVAMYLVARTLGSDRASLAVTALFAAGTPMWAYSGTLFTEPLTIALLLVGFLCVQLGRPWSYTAAGTAMGAAVAVHVSALLSVPFLLGFAIAASLDRRRAAVALGAGLLPVLALLGAYNHMRFGDILETGRTVDPYLARQFGYGAWTDPSRGAWGLLLSPGKGVVFYAPIVMLSLVAWPALHRRSAVLSLAIAAMAFARLSVVAARTDWHGGYSLGPRLMLLVVPFLVLALVPWLDERLRAARRRTCHLLAAVGLVLVAQQAWFAAGDEFLFYHLARHEASTRGVDAMVGDELYLSWRYSPLVHLMDSDVPSGSWLGRSLGLSAVQTWGVLVVVVGAGWLALIRWVDAAGSDAAVGVPAGNKAIPPDQAR